MLVPTAALANVTKRANSSLPAAASIASVVKTNTLAASTNNRLQTTGFSRSLVAFHLSSCSSTRRALKRSTIQSANPNSRSSFAAGASTASR